MFTSKAKRYLIFSFLIYCLICACHGASDASDKNPLPAELIGEWHTGSISSIQYVDPNTGIFKPTVGMGEGYAIRPDGGYVDNVLVQSNIGADFIYIEGAISVSADKLTFHQTKRIAMHKEPGAQEWTKKTAEPQPDRTCKWRIKTEEESGKPVISLCLREAESNATDEPCYKKSN
jgi:hypothetical protein